jgi:hypothetical protein
MRLALMLWMVAMLAAPLGAQERPSPAFDVASVKPNKSGETRAQSSVAPAPGHRQRTTLRHHPHGYQTRDLQVVGLPT